MKPIKLLKTALFTLLCICSVLAKAQPDTLEIIGPTIVCSETENEYYIDTTGIPSSGMHWQVFNNVNGYVLTQAPYISNVMWTSAGTGRLILTIHDVSNQLIYIGIKDVTILNPPKPSLSSDSKVKCQKVGLMDDAEFDTSICINVCANNCVTYYGHGEDNSTFDWTVFGGTINAQGDDWCEVCWDNPGSGFITVEETTENGCVGEKTYCVEIIESPFAHFVALPDTTLRMLDICDSTEVIFLDKSVASSGSPIVSWHWDFGDGTFSNEKGSLSAPVTHMYAGPGHYTATLTVTNRCGCTSSETIEINVDPNTRLNIECPRVVCEGDTGVYSVNTTCTTGTWSVIGGSVLGTTPTSVLIKWDAVSADGFGYVTFDASACGLPCAFTTVKVPVVMNTGNIEGPTKLCPNSNYVFSMPQWPTTNYVWTLNGGALATISPTDQPNEIVINTSTAESITLTCNYMNTMLGCGGTATLNINVLDPVTLSGPDKICLNTNGSFLLSGTNAGTSSWVLTDPNVSTQTGSGATFVGTFDEVGTYVLTVTGAYCPVKPKLLKIDPLPPAPDTILGLDSFCRGIPESFRGGDLMPGTIFNWAVSNGIVNSASGDNTLITMDMSAGPFIIYLWRETKEEPFCRSDSITKEIYPPVVSHTVMGEDSPCLSREYPYQSDYNAGEHYEWDIVPHTMGSVRSGDGTQNVSVLWNNDPGVAMLICKMTKCFTEYRDTLYVDVGALPSVVYSGPATVCADNLFTVSVSNATAEFNFGDGTGVYSDNSGSYTYKYSPYTDTTVGINVRVTNQCGYSYYLDPSPVITVYPAPAGIVAPSLVTSCATINDTLVYTYLGSGSTVSFSYQWYKDGVAIPGANNDSYIGTAFGEYWLEVNSGSPTFCTWISDTVKLLERCPCFNALNSTIDSIGVTCDEITVTGTYDPTDFNSASWVFFDPEVLITSQTYNTVTAIAPHTGSFTVGYRVVHERGGVLCETWDYKTVTVDYVPSLHYNFTCNSAGTTREVILISGTYVLPTKTFVYEFFVDNVLVQSNNNKYWKGYVGTGVHEIKLRASRNGDTCEITDSMNVQLINADFTFERDTTCEKEAPVQFLNTSTAYLNSFWHFGDNARNTQDHPARVYNTFGDFDAKLIVTDIYGCKDSVTKPVYIIGDSIEGTIDVTPRFLCPTDGVLFEYQRDIVNGFDGYPENYYWYRNRGVAGETDIPVWGIGAVSGMWWVLGENHYGCVARSDAGISEVVNIPPPLITGDRDVCVNVPHTLNGYAGSDPNLVYTWLRNGAVVFGATGPVISITDTTADTSTYRVVYEVYDSRAGFACTDTSEPYEVITHATPATPVPSFAITDCITYEVELTANHISGASEFFNWSNGLSGTPVYAYNGGAYELEFTDEFGCKSDTAFYVPKDPKVYLWTFPTGCWSICPPQHYVITGPVATFSYWDYMNNAGGSVHSGSSSAPTSYTNLAVDAPGTFNLFLDNGYCSAMSGDMIVDVNCTPITWAGRPGRQGLTTEEIERLLQPALNLVPNPAENGTKIVYTFTSYAAEKTIELYDMTGKRIRVQPVNNIQGAEMLSLHDLAPGLYQVILRQNGVVLANERLTVIK